MLQQGLHSGVRFPTPLSPGSCQACESRQSNNLFCLDSQGRCATASTNPTCQPIIGHIWSFFRYFINPVIAHIGSFPPFQKRLYCLYLPSTFSAQASCATTGLHGQARLRPSCRSPLAPCHLLSGELGSSCCFTSRPTHPGVLESCPLPRAPLFNPLLQVTSTPCPSLALSKTRQRRRGMWQANADHR